MKVRKQLCRGIKIAVTLTFAISSLLLLSPEALLTANAAEVQDTAVVSETLSGAQSTSGNITIQANMNVVWKYKIENNKMYKRLLDCDTGKWLTDWIFVCDIL